MDDKREFLRHTLATLAYRATRALEDAPADFAAYDGAGRKPIQILAHMGDLLDWALSISAGHERWKNSEPLSRDGEQKRFFAALKAFDDYLASAQPIHAPLERLFQGPVADALTHVGQLAMLRRVAGSAAWGENYYVAEISRGNVGPNQPAAVKRFK